MEKSILILGSSNYQDYSSVHNALKQIGIGYIKNNPILTLSGKGVGNHVYHYCRYNRMNEKYTNINAKVSRFKNLFKEIDHVYVLGKLDDDFMVKVAREAESKNIPVNYVGL